MLISSEQLKRTIESHGRWQLGDPSGSRADLSRADLSRADLSRADLRGADLRGADLRGADLRGADLRGADLRGANLRGANLSRADLRGADLRGADLRGADLDYSCLPLWCGSLNMTVDKRIAVQVLYHFCRLKCDDDSVKEAQKQMAQLANQFHRVYECGHLSTPMGDGE